MSANPSQQPDERPKGALSPFRRAILRGLAVVMPPLLTIVLFLWVWNAIEKNVLTPMENGAEQVMVWWIADVKDTMPNELERRGFDGRDHVNFDGEVYAELPSGKWIPAAVVEKVTQHGGESPPITADGYYQQYVRIMYLRRTVVIPCFLLVFVIVLYLLGKFMAAGVGRILWNTLEGVIHRLPIVRNVYSSVKQVTDFIFSEQTVEFNRVVAVQYPRKGIWSIGFVTGESMLDISAAANEPVISVLMPTSPMPATGFTITVPKSETIDLNITIDQAIQFVVSCGVVVAPQQMHRPAEIREAIEAGAAERNLEGAAHNPTLGISGVRLAPRSNGNEAADQDEAPKAKEQSETSGDA